MRGGLAICLLALVLAGCGRADLAAVRVNAAAGGDVRATRIVSLDYCADQYLLKLADREQILAVSPDAGADYSYMRASASGLQSVRPVAEDVLLLKPDLVVRSYGGGPGISPLLERAGVRVVQIGWTSQIDGDGPGTITGNLRDVARGLGQSARGEVVIAETRARLSALAGRRPGASAMYLTPGGVTSGPGSLIDEMLLAAGLSNFETRAGWRPIPLERLAYELPGRFVYARFEGGAGPWSAARHPLLRRQLQRAPVTQFEGAWTACGGWFILDAVEALATGSRESLQE